MTSFLCHGCRHFCAGNVTICLSCPSWLSSSSSSCSPLTKSRGGSFLCEECSSIKHQLGHSFHPSMQVSGSLLHHVCTAGCLACGLSCVIKLNNSTSTSTTRIGPQQQCVSETSLVRVEFWCISSSDSNNAFRNVQSDSKRRAELLERVASHPLSFRWTR